MGKTPRRPGRKDDSFQPSGESKRIIPLNEGKNAYLKDFNGKTLRFDRYSDEFIAACILNDEKMLGKITRELELLGWTDILEKMNDNGEGSEVAASL